MPALVGVEFSPRYGESVSSQVAERLLASRRRVVVCSMLLSSSRLLRALDRLIDRGEVSIEGVYDETLMAGLVDVWEHRPELAWKAAAFRRVVGTGRFVGKASGPLPIEGSPNRLGVSALVVDDTVLTGSYSFAHSAGANADHLLTVESPDLADRIVGYARRLQDRYRQTSILAVEVPPHGSRAVGTSVLQPVTPAWRRAGPEG
jgi:hypothetical protein